MKRIHVPLFACLALLAPGLTAAQQPAAKMLAVAGDVSIVRESDRVAALAGMDVHAREAVDLADGTAQLRFTDGGLVSLRPRTLFRIAEYAFGQDRVAVLELLKGGLRTVTGLVGKVAGDRYADMTFTSAGRE